MNRMQARRPLPGSPLTAAQARARHRRRFLAAAGALVCASLALASLGVGEPSSGGEGADAAATLLGAFALVVYLAKVTRRRWRRMREPWSRSHESTGADVCTPSAADRGLRGP